MRPDSTHFHTQDFSRKNEDRHRWNRIDTFQTPHGHSGPKESKESIRDSTTVWSGDLRSLLGELLDEIRYEFQAERSHYSDMEELKSYVAKVVGESTAEIKAAFRADAKDATQVSMDLTPVMSVDSQITAVLDNIRMINDKLNDMSSQAPSKVVKVDVDVQLVVDEIRKLHAVTEKFNETMHGFRPAFEVITDSQLSSDVGSVLNAVTRVDGKLTEVHDRVANFEQAVDTRPLLNAIAALDAKVAAVKEGPQPQDVTQIMEAIAKIEMTKSPSIHLTSDTGPFVDALDKLDAKLTGMFKQQPADLRPMLDQILTQVSGDMGHVLSAVSTVEAKMKDLKTDLRVDLQPVIDQIEHINSGPRTEITQVLNAIENIQPSVDLGAVLDAIANMKPSVDMGAVIDAIYKIETPMVDAIAKMDVRPQMNLQPVLDAINALQEKPDFKIDFTPVLSAIQGIRIDVPDNMLPVFNSVAEIMQHLQSVSTPALHSLSEKLSQVDSSLAKLQGNPQCLAGSAGLALRGRPRSSSPARCGGSRSPSPIRVGGGYELQDEAVKDAPLEPTKPEGSPQNSSYIQGRSPVRNDRYVVGSFVAGGEVIRPDRKYPTDLEGRTVNLYRVLRPDPGKVDTPMLETWYR